MSLELSVIELSSFFYFDEEFPAILFFLKNTINPTSEPMPRTNPVTAKTTTILLGSFRFRFKLILG